MKLKNLLQEVATLVEEREIIDHGTIRCLHTQADVDSICSAEDIEEVDLGSVGDDELAEKIRKIIESPDCLLDADADDLGEAITQLWDAHKGPSVEDYLESEKEDELHKLDNLITAAEKLIEATA